MKNQKRECGAGLQEWLSYQARTREVAAQPETDIIDWDQGIEVQEEWLPREQCEERLREEVERNLAPATKAALPAESSPAPSAPMIDADDVALAVASSLPAMESVEAPMPVEVKEPAARERIAREPAPREAKPKVAAPAQIEADLVNAVPAYQR